MADAPPPDNAGPAPESTSPAGVDLQPPLPDGWAQNTAATTDIHTLAARASLSPTARLDGALAAARRVLRAGAVAEGAVAVVAAATAAALVAIAVVGVVPFSAGLRLGLLGLIGASGFLAAVVVAAVRGRVLRHDLVIAARLEEAMARRGRPVGDAIRGAVELRDSAGGDDARLGRSRALCDAHINATVDGIEEGEAQSSIPAVGLERAVPTLLMAAAVATVVVVVAAVAKDTALERLRRLMSAEAAATALAERAAAQPPLVTDITLTLRFPAYMARADEVIPGSSGDVSAPRGTEVTVVGRAEGPISGAALLVTGGSAELSLAADVDGNTVRGRFTVDAPGAWRFKLDDGKKTRIDPVARKILVRADAAPTVELQAPLEDRVVQLKDEIKVVFSAEDDFGISKVRLVVKRQGQSRPAYTTELQSVSGLKSTAGGGTFVVEATGARPGEKLAVTVEVDDNDTINGPNIGRSVTRVLTVFSAAEHHREVIERLEALMMQMVELLADELESPLEGQSEADDQRRLLSRHSQIAQKANALLLAFDTTLTAVADDEVFSDTDGVRRALANMRLEQQRAIAMKALSIERHAPQGARVVPLGLWRRVVEAQAVVVDRLERDIIYLEDLLQRERLREAQRLVEDVKRAQGDLKALLQQYKETGDEAAREALMAEIQRMQQQLADLAKRLGELRREVPDEFLNEEAFQTDEAFDKAKSLDEMIEEGRLEDAEKALSDMLESTEKMLKELESAEDEVGGNESKALREKLERFTDELQALETAQKEALKETEEIMDTVRKRAEERFGKKVQTALQDAKKKAKAARDALKGISADAANLNRFEEEDVEAAKDRTDELERALEAGDIDDAVKAAEEAEAAASAAESSVDDRNRRRGSFSSPSSKKAAAALREAATALREARELLDRATPDPSDLLDGKERDRLQKAAERQAQLAEQAQKLAEQMGEIGKEAPIFGPQHSQQLGEAQSAMREAQEKLKGQSRPRPARGGLRQGRAAQSTALQQLQGLKSALEEMGKGSGGGVPMPLPGGGSPGSERSERDGRGGRDDVKIPDGSDFKVKDAFRKDILDAMRESAPGEWAGEVKRYYEELIK